MKRLYKARYDRIALGVCGGIAHYFQIDPTLLRILFVILCIFTAFIPLLIGYLLAALIIPLEPKGMLRHDFRRLYRSRIDRKIAGVCGGLAEFLKVDPTVVRIFTIFLCFITGILPLFFAYLIAWGLIPEKI